MTQDVLLDAMQKLEELERDAATIRHALAAVVADREIRTEKILQAVRESGGMLCHDEGPVVPALCSDASAAIPARVLKQCAEGGE